MAVVVDPCEILNVCANETNNNTYENLLKYKECFQVQPDKKIKWLGNFDELKCLIFDLFGVDGKWSSPRGSAKAFRNDKITITYYTNKKSLLFQGQEGNRLKEVILNQSSKSSDLFTDSIVSHESIPCASNNDNLLYASQIVAKTAKISMISGNTRSKSEVTETTSDCSTLEDLQDFIDFSYQNILPLSDNANLSSTRIFDCSTPSRSSVGDNSPAIEKLFGTFKREFESKVEALIFELSEQKETIDRCKQDICKLTSENLNLKSRLAELEQKAFPKNKSNNVTKNAETNDVISSTLSYYLLPTVSNEAPSATNGSTISSLVNNHQVCVPMEGSSETAVLCSPFINNQPAVVCDKGNNSTRKPLPAKECMPPKANENIEPSNHRLTRSSKVIPPTHKESQPIPTRITYRVPSNTKMKTIRGISKYRKNQQVHNGNYTDKYNRRPDSMQTARNQANEEHIYPRPFQQAPRFHYPWTKPGNFMKEWQAYLNFVRMAVTNPPKLPRHPSFPLQRVETLV